MYPMMRGRTGSMLLLAMLASLALAVGFATTSVGVAQGKEQAIKVGKKGEIHFSEQTVVGDVTLKPGDYIFQHRIEGEDHLVHFTQVTEKLYPGSSVGSAKAHPGEVKCKLEPRQEGGDDESVPE